MAHEHTHIVESVPAGVGDAQTRALYEEIGVLKRQLAAAEGEGDHWARVADGYRRTLSMLAKQAGGVLYLHDLEVKQWRDGEYTLTAVHNDAERRTEFRLAPVQPAKEQASHEN